MEKNWYIVSDLREKVSPLSPNALLIQVMLSEAFALIDVWDMTNRGSSNSALPKFDFNCDLTCEHGDNCNELCQVFQLFFP